MPYPIFDRSRLHLLPLNQREHDVAVEDLYQLDDPVPPFESEVLAAVAQRVVAARRRGAAVILMMGAHPIKAGLSRFVIDLLQRGMISHIAGNGAVAIHDTELAMIGATSESVSRYIRTGQFGLWQESGVINEFAQEATADGIGLGEAAGRAINERDFPHKDISILASAYQLGVPMTIHVGIGYDIVHEHPNCDGAAIGASSYRDFLVLAHSVSQLEGGVLLNLGTSVMGPETYLKALSMARNVAEQEGRQIRHFSTAVFDLIPLPDDYHYQPPKSDPFYYFRPWKTILVRTVADGGESFYINADHRVTLPHLHRLITSIIE